MLVQNIRKTNEFDIADRINVIYEAPKEIEKAIEKHLDYIKEEVLAITFEKGSASETIKINDFEMKISIEKSI